MEHFDSVVFTEALCVKRAAGVEARTVDSIDFLLAERFDYGEKNAQTGAELIAQIILEGSS